MLFFGLSFAAGIAAVIAAQKMDIECVNPEAPKRAARRRKAETRLPAADSFVSGGAYLRQQ